VVHRIAMFFSAQIDKITFFHLPVNISTPYIVRIAHELLWLSRVINVLFVTKTVILKRIMLSNFIEHGLENSCSV
jgi:hypothetical protein